MKNQPHFRRDTNNNFWNIQVTYFVDSLLSVTVTHVSYPMTLKQLLQQGTEKAAMKAGTM